VIPFDPPKTGNTVADKILTLLTNSLRSLRLAVTNDVLVTATIETTDTRVFHTLDQQPTTWEVVGIDTAATVHESATANAARERYLLLKASAPVTVTLRFT
jgi:hypothetical protein